jgi:hypothetical protein
VAGAEEEIAMTTRRDFMIALPLAGGAVFPLRQLRAEAAPLDPADPQAVALGYRTDATRVDRARYPQFQPGQHCANCQLFGGAAGADHGPCPIYGGRQVAAGGWCSAWVKKA